MSVRRPAEITAAIVAAVGVVTAAVVTGGFGILKDDAPPRPQVEVGDLNNVECPAIGVDVNVRCEEVATDERRDWLRQPEWIGPPDDWSVVEDARQALDLLFGDETIIVEGPDNFAEETTYRRLGSERFSIRAIDLNTVSAFPPSWVGPYERPYSASVRVTLGQGPRPSIACGIAFGLIPDPSDPEGYRPRWRVAKLSGTAAMVTEHRPIVDGEINHPRLAEFHDAVDTTTDVEVAVVVEEDGWRVGIDGRLVASGTDPIDPAFIAPVVQQESTAQRADVTCEFDAWEVRAP